VAVWPRRLLVPQRQENYQQFPSFMRHWMCSLLVLQPTSYSLILPRKPTRRFRLTVLSTLTQANCRRRRYCSMSEEVERKMLGYHRTDTLELRPFCERHHRRSATGHILAASTLSCSPLVTQLQIRNFLPEIRAGAPPNQSATRPAGGAPKGSVSFCARIPVLGRLDKLWAGQPVPLLGTFCGKVPNQQFSHRTIRWKNPPSPQARRFADALANSR